jgi:ribosomal protein L29
MGDLLNNEALLALAGTIFGGVGLKVIEQLLGRGKRRVDIATSLRNELRTELTELRDDNDKLESALDEWRTKYFKLVAHMATQGIPLPPD